jgi:hypothetical protein
MDGNIDITTPPVKDDEFLADHAAEIRRLGQRAISDIIEIGRHLFEVHEYLDHGAWLPWIESEFGWSDQTARRFIHLFEQSRDPKFNTLLNSDLPLSALYRLAAPKTPPEAVSEIAGRVEAGEKLDTAAVVQAIQGKRRKKSSTESGRHRRAGGHHRAGHRHHQHRQHRRRQRRRGRFSGSARGALRGRRGRS